MWRCGWKVSRGAIFPTSIPASPARRRWGSSDATPIPGARSRAVNPVFAEFTGELQAPLITLHETADFRVPLVLERNYRQKVEAAGSGKRLVQRVVAGAGHCAIDGRVR